MNTEVINRNLFFFLGKKLYATDSCDILRSEQRNAFLTSTVT